MNMKNTTLLAVALLSGAYMNGAEETPAASENKCAKTAWNNLVTVPYNALTLEGFEHPSAEKFRKSIFVKTTPVEGSLELDTSAVSQEPSKEALDAKVAAFNKGYNATNYKRAYTSLAVSALSGGACVASLYLTRGGQVDSTMRKVQIGTGAVAATSLVTAAGFRWKAGADVENAIGAMSTVPASVENEDDKK